MAPYITRLVSGLILSCGLVASPAQSAEAPWLMLKMSAGLQAGKIMDGTRIGQGAVVSRDGHSGFQVWCESGCLSFEGLSPRYVLTGTQNARNQLRVRLQPAQQEPPAGDVSLRGMVLRTVDEQLKFDVLADGEQKVNPDSYTLEIKSVLLAAEEE
ncbi:AfaD family invasin [Erwinia sp. HDF1-3R]|uniref:AfaD family invasin n=1 Tax=Erwinia sp. HDF1-3R TaxID=3141543 RepID=UPI0031F557C2